MAASFTVPRSLLSMNFRPIPATASQFTLRNCVSSVSCYGTQTVQQYNVLLCCQRNCTQLTTSQCSLCRTTSKLFLRNQYGTWSRQHGLDCARRQSMLPFDDKLVSIGRDKLDVHRVRTFTAAKLVFLDFSHFFALKYHTNSHPVTRLSSNDWTWLQWTFHTDSKACCSRTHPSTLCQFEPMT